jgi:hypothetical protein
MPNIDYDTSAEKQKLLDKWNPAPTDEALARLVGVPTEVGDTRATAHVPMEVLNHQFNAGNSDVDAGLLAQFRDDGDDDDKAARKAARKAAKAAKKSQSSDDAGGEGDEGDKYDAMNAKDLKAEIDSRNEGRDGDDVLVKGGKVEEIRQRLRDDDAR